MEEKKQEEKKPEEKKQEDIRSLTDEETDKVSGGAHFVEFIRP